jgi:bacterioferritin (cytochrome b1)
MTYKIPGLKGLTEKEAGVPKEMDPIPAPKDPLHPENRETALKSRYVTDRLVANQAGRANRPEQGQQAKAQAREGLRRIKAAAGAGFDAAYEAAGSSIAPEAAPAEEAYAPPPPTASEGVHPLAVSPEEGLFAVPQEKIVAQCLKLLKLKYTTMLAYINYGDRIRAHFRDSIYEHFKEHADEEREDAYHLAMKITALGGEPTPKVATIPDVNELHQMFMILLQMEKELLQELRNLSAMAGENLSIKVMLEQMALTDQQHADDLRRMTFHE